MALQQPTDLDVAYELALLHESLTNSIPQYHQSNRRQQFSHPASTVKTVASKTTDDRRNSSKVQKQKMGEDKWEALRSYHKAKGLCFMCGEKWSQDHQCKQIVSLHVVQEMVEFFQCTSSEELGSDKAMKLI